MPLCKKCGYNTPEDSVFCPRCGASMQLTEVRTASGMHKSSFVMGAMLCLFPGILRLIDYLVYYILVVLFHVATRTPLSYISQALFSLFGLPLSNIALILLIDLTPPSVGIVLLLKAFRPNSSIRETLQAIIRS